MFSHLKMSFPSPSLFLWDFGPSSVACPPYRDTVPQACVGWALGEGPVLQVTHWYGEQWERVGRRRE